MTRGDTIQCIHEPFGDAFYFGPEKMSPAFADNPEKCSRTGHAESTYASIISSIEDIRAASPDHRIFIKDMSYHVVPCYPHLTPTNAAPSLATLRTEGDIHNPSLLPWEVLKEFEITFLIRNPVSSIPSKYRFTVPPLQQTTDMKQFYHNEVGYRELRLMFDFLRDQQADDVDSGRIVVIDAEDLQADPPATIRAYCNQVGVEFDEDMLRWDREEDLARASQLLEKYRPYHLDALESKGMRSMQPQAERENDEIEDAWRKSFGEEGAKILRQTVNGAMADYQYLRQFRLKIDRSEPNH